MLKKIRIALASIFFAGITLLMLGIGNDWWGWMTKLQFLPSCLALNFAVIGGILLFTLLFGRLYCSVICPMGVFQDAVIKLRSLFGGKKMRFGFVREHRWARYIILALSVVAIATGIQLFIAVIAPYSAYGRMVRSIAGFFDGSAWGSGLAVTAVGGITLIAIFLCAWFFGREYCNTVCPVGTTLSFFSRFSLFRPTIDEDKCVHCHSCEKQCKAKCIDINDMKIDYSRCVDCFDCMDNCKTGAIQYKAPLFSRKEEKSAAAESKGTSRRAFLSGSAMLGGVLLSKAQDKQGGLAPLEKKQEPERSERLVPFGAKGAKNFYSRCTACQRCVSSCPNGVLRPSTDFDHFIQPKMNYDLGFCRPECTICSQVCPSGAILPVEADDKLNIKIGTAHVDRESCIACGNCVRHCPVGALRMIKDEAGKRILTVNEEVCIGCGACEYLCPVRPLSAITVNGLSEHRRKS